MKNELLKIFISGGYVMFPLLICSLLSMTIIIERLISLREKRIIKQQEIDKLNNLIENGFYDKALELCIANPNPLTNIIRVIIENKELPQESLRQIISDSAKLELPYIEKYLTALSTLASVSPLLGLLGTVTGMMKVFRVITTIGLGEPAALSGGIAEALITTAAGLFVAVPAVWLYNYFTTKVDRIQNELTNVSSDLLDYLLGVQEAQHGAKHI